LETTGLSVEEVATEVGFRSAWVCGSISAESWEQIHWHTGVPSQPARGSAHKEPRFIRQKPAADENEDQAPVKSARQTPSSAETRFTPPDESERRCGFASLPEHVINMNRRRIYKNTSITSRSRCGALTDILWACCRIRGGAETEPSARAADSVWAADRYFGLLEQ